MSKTSFKNSTELGFFETCIIVGAYYEVWHFTLNGTPGTTCFSYVTHKGDNSFPIYTKYGLSLPKGLIA